MKDKATIQARAILALKRDGFTIPEMQLALSVSRPTIQRRLKELRELARAGANRIT